MKLLRSIILAFFILTISIILAIFVFSRSYFNEIIDLIYSSPIVITSSTLERNPNYEFTRGTVYFLICDVTYSIESIFYCNREDVRIQREYKATSNIYYSFLITTPKTVLDSILYNKDIVLVIIPKNTIKQLNGLQTYLSKYYDSNTEIFVKISYLKNSLSEHSTFSFIYLQQVIYLLLLIGLMLIFEYEIKNRFLIRGSTGIVSYKIYSYLIFFVTITVSLLLTISIRDFNRIDVLYIVNYLIYISKFINVLVAANQGNFTFVLVYFSLWMVYALISYISLLGLINYKRILK